MDNNFVRDRDLSQNSEICGFYEMNKSVHQSKTKQEIFKNSSEMESFAMNSNPDFSPDITHNLNTTNQCDINMGSIKTVTHVSGTKLKIIETKFNPFVEVDDYKSGESNSEIEDSQLLSPSIDHRLNFSKNDNNSKPFIDAYSPQNVNKTTERIKKDKNTSNYKNFDHNKAYVLMKNAKKNENNQVLNLQNEYILKGEKIDTPEKGLEKNEDLDYVKIEEYQTSSPQIVKPIYGHFPELESPGSGNKTGKLQQEINDLVMKPKSREQSPIKLQSYESPRKNIQQDKAKKDIPSRTYFDIIKDQRQKYSKQNNNIKKLKINDMNSAQEYFPQKNNEKQLEKEMTEEKISQNDAAKELLGTYNNPTNANIKKNPSHSNSFAYSKHDSQHSKKPMKAKNITKHRKKLSDFSDVPSESYVNKASQKIINSNRPKNVKVEDQLLAKAEMRDHKVEQIKKSLESSFKPKICTKSRSIVSEKGQAKVFDRLYAQSKKPNYNNPSHVTTSKHAEKNIDNIFQNHLYSKTQYNTERGKDLFTMDQIEDINGHENYRTSPAKLNPNIDVTDVPKSTISNIIDNLNKASKVYKDLIESGELNQDLNMESNIFETENQDIAPTNTRLRESKKEVTTRSYESEYNFDLLRERQLQNQYTTGSENLGEYSSTPNIMHSKLSYGMSSNNYTGMSRDRADKFYDKSIMWLKKKEAKIEELRHTKVLDEIEECYFTPQIQEYYVEETVPKDTTTKFKIVFQGNTYDQKSENDQENFFMKTVTRRAVQNTSKTGVSIDQSDLRFDKRSNSIQNYQEFICDSPKKDDTTRNFSSKAQTNRKSVFQKNLDKMHMVYDSILGRDKNKWKCHDNENSGEEFIAKLNNNGPNDNLNQALTSNRFSPSKDYSKSNKSNSKFESDLRNYERNDLNTVNAFFNNRK